MDEYTVTLQHSPTITDTERRRRLGRVYALLLNVARRGEQERADGELLADEPSAGAALAEGGGEGEVEHGDD